MARDTANRRHQAGAFDIRVFIGSLLGIYGVVLLLTAFLGTSEEALQRADGLNINLWTGLALLGVAAGFVAWARLRPVVVPDDPQELHDDAVTDGEEGTMSIKVGSTDSSEALDHGVRAGLVTYGIVHLVVAWTALQLAFGDSSGKASQTGALQQLAQDSMGGITLYVAALGFLALLVWQGLEAALGHRSEEGAKRAFKRAASAAKAVVYAVLAFSSVRIASGSGGGSGGGGGGGGSSSSTDAFTAQLMSAPGGQLLVGAVGLGVIAAGGYLAYKGVTRKFTKRIDRAGTSGDRRKPVVVLGTIGYVAKGFVLASVGGLFVVAAVQHQAKKSGGLDQALHTLLQQPFGAPLLVAVALGLACYGVYCFLWARHLDR